MEDHLNYLTKAPEFRGGAFLVFNRELFPFLLGLLPSPELVELVSAVVASYLIAHCILPLNEESTGQALHRSLSHCKGMKVGHWLDTPTLIDVLIAEILDNVKENIKMGTFNPSSVIMQVCSLWPSGA